MSYYFSIVTPAYNAERFILNAITSVVQQTERDYEYIIIDNGSTDGTAEIVRNFMSNNPKANIKLHRLEENQGISGGRNAGINIATGQYICFLDADDEWYPNKLEVVKRAINKNKDCQVFCHWEEFVRKGISTTAKYRSINNENAFEDLLINGNCLSPSAVTVKTDAIKMVSGFDLNLKLGEEDFDCWLRLAKSGFKFHTIQEILGIWLIREDSLSAKHIQHTEAVIAMLQPHFDYLREVSDNKRKVDRQRKKNKALNYFACARNVSLSGKRKLGTKLYFKSIKCDCFYFKSYAGIILNIVHL